MSDEGRLPYFFSPIPRSVRVARRQGLIDDVDYSILAELYDRADTDLIIVGGETPRLTLARLAQTLGWTKTADALWKRLKALADDGYLSWRVERRDWYVFRLHPTEDGSEDVRRSGRTSVRRSDSPQSLNASGIARPEPLDRSEIHSEATPGSVRRSADEIRRSELPANGFAEPFETVADSDAFGGLQTFSDNKPLFDRSDIRGSGKSELREYEQPVDEGAVTDAFLQEIRRVMDEPETTP